MVSVWWAVMAFLAGGAAGAILVSIMSINPRSEEYPVEHSLEALDEPELRLLA